MTSHYSILKKFSIIALVLLCAGVLPNFAKAQDDVADSLSKAIQFYSELEFEKGIALVQNILDRPDLTKKDSAAGLATLSMLTYGKGQDYIRKSYEYLDQIADLGPCIINLPQNFWPQQLRDQWYKILYGKNMMTCQEDNSERPLKTVAVMEFDNYSMEKYRQKLGYLAKGLADFFEADFSKISDLKVVERDKVDFILKELELTKSGMVLTSDAVRVGKLLGAQIMIFGSLMQTDDNDARMLVKAVNVETSEIMAYVEKEGKPDYFKMEKEMVKELADRLDLVLNDHTRSMLEKSGTESQDAASLYSQGLYYMDQYNYAKAYDFFKKAYEKDNSFEEAKEKMEVYRPLISS